MVDCSEVSRRTWEYLDKQREEEEMALNDGTNEEK
jgi:hypothetical protein